MKEELLFAKENQIKFEKNQGEKENISGENNK